MQIIQIPGAVSIRSLPLLFALVFAPAMIMYAQESSTPLCIEEDVRTDVSPSVRGILVTEHKFAAGLDASAVVRVRNVSTKPIVSLQFVMDYYAENDTRLGEVIFQAHTMSLGGSFHALGHATLPKVMAGPVEANEVFSVGGLGLFTTSRCPARAILTWILLRFSDGSSFNWFAPNWQLPPYPSELRLDKMLACLERSGNPRVLLVLQIDRTGRVLRAITVQPVEHDAQECVRAGVNAWKFEPALRAAKPVASEITLLLRLHRNNEKESDTWQSVTSSEVTQLLTIVDALPRSLQQASWDVFYAGVAITGLLSRAVN